MTKLELTAEVLRSKLDYDPETGIFTWRARAGGKYCGAVAGTPDGGGWGHLRIRVNYVSHAAHRLAWLYVHGEWPKQHIDHINGDPKDNRISNLRDVSNQVNQQNRRRVRACSSHPFMGATLTKRGWMAKIRSEGKAIYLGTFETPEAANDAYVQAKRRLHPGCTI